MNYFLYFILIFSTIFQDLSIGDKLGNIAYSLTSIITPIAFIIYLVFNRSIEVSKYTKKLCNLMIYLVLVSLIGLFMYVVILGNDSYYWGQSLFTKGVKASTYFLDIILFLITVENLQKKLNINKVYYPFICTYFVLFFVLLFEICNPILFNSIFHNSDEYNRIRLLTSESSCTGTLIMVFFVATLYYYTNIKRNRLMIIVSTCIFVIFLLTSRSKGFFSCLIIIAIYFMLRNIKINSLKKFIKLSLSIVIFIIVCKLFIYYILPMFNIDIEKYTSIATRIYTTFCAFKISLIYPLGVGTGMYPIVYSTQLYQNLSAFNYFNVSLNLNEILSLINSVDGKDVSAKVPIAQYSMYWGILGSIYFLYSYWFKIYTKARNNSAILLGGFIFIFVAICTYVSFENKYEIWAFLTLIYGDMHIHELENQICKNV